MIINPILEAIDAHMEDVELYLSEVKPEDFVAHIYQLRAQSADQVIIEKAITELNKLKTNNK